MGLTELSMGCLFFLVVLSIAFILLKQEALGYKKILVLLLLSAIGHFLGGWFYYWFSLTQGSDSVFYFHMASTRFIGWFGYNFAFFVLGYLRKFVIDNSFLEAFFFCASLGFLGSVFYLLTYKRLLDKALAGGRHALDGRLIFVPAVILLCWPSYFFWSAGLVKDSFAFLAIPMFLFALSAKRVGVGSLILIVFSLTLAYMVRPYLFLVIFVSGVGYLLLKSKLSVAVKIFLIALVLLIAVQLLESFVNYAKWAGLQSFSLEGVARRSILNQQYMSVGSSIPVPTKNPHLLYLFIPYLIAANLLLPFFVGAHNALAFICSFENLFFLYLVIQFVKQRATFKMLQKKIPIVSFLLFYFLTGMALLAMVNTNLGLAMREKMMYVPSFILVILLTYTYKRVLRASL